ncbi:MAG: hypothetical protein ABSG42_02955, partial [Nitrospirota bacterium]
TGHAAKQTSGILIPQFPMRRDPKETFDGSRTESGSVLLSRQIDGRIPYESNNRRLHRSHDHSIYG